ncbi:unnamed protein product [Pylaiella littoralis]
MNDRGNRVVQRKANSRSTVYWFNIKRTADPQCT